ncbi:MAG: molybdopterin molybdotransferase MoeA [Acidimicrobiia bacterium]|nr:molybdopterin molybdotransferase MoeA [Acidimicrobiia bacterium]MDX2467313.1 molybdopterin molybdotransferase MoeA [Acidimicrobiia bacterium]
MRPLEQAQRDVLAAIEQLPAGRIELANAAGLALAEAVVARHDLPPFANSAMDGYAVIASDVAEPPVVLDVLEDVAAGSVPTQVVVPGSAIKIMTGAPMPAGADTVVPVEDTEPGETSVRILAAWPHGSSVRPAGGDVSAGTTVLQIGERLTPARLGVCASLGYDRPLVRRRPRVAIMSTGDEIVGPETAELAPGKIRDANRFTLRGSLDELGVEVIDMGIVGDDAAALRDRFAEAASVSDVVVSSGGVSMGEYDLVKHLLAELGSVDFWKVAMKPAKPFAFGRLGDTPFFGLPGNPVSVAVAYEQFLRPALLHMMGASFLFRPRFMGVLKETVVTDPEKVVFLRVAIVPGADGLLQASLSGAQGSNILTALAAADALAVIPVGIADVAAGTLVELEMLRMPESRTAAEVTNV